MRVTFAWAVVVVLVGGSQVTAETQRASAVEVPVTTTDVRLNRAVTSPVIARSSAVPAFLIAASRTDMPGPGCDLHASGDSGASWREVNVDRVLSDSVEGCHAPYVDVTREGRVVVSFVEMSGTVPTPQSLYVVASDDHAQTFTRPRRLTDVQVAASGLAVTDETMHVVWLQTGDDSGGSQEAGHRRLPVGQQVRAASTPAGGSGTVNSVVVSGGSDGFVAAPAVAAGPDGRVAVAYYQLPSDASVGDGDDSATGAGRWRLMVANRPDGEAFSDPVEVDRFGLPAVEGRPPYAHPMLVAEQGIIAPGLAVGAGRTCVGWTDQNRSGLDALVACSSDGQQWEKPVRVGGDLADETFQWMPQVAVTPQGTAAAVFWHHRPDADRGRDVDVYYSSAGLVGGLAGPGLRLTSQSSNASRGPLQGWFGTRLALVDDTHGTVAMWADTRNGLPRVHATQDVFAAVLPRPQPDGTTQSSSAASGWKRPALVTAGLAAVVVATLLWRRGRTARGHRGTL